MMVDMIILQVKWIVHIKVVSFNTIKDTNIYKIEGQNKKKIGGERSAKLSTNK